ncbi:MAG: DNA-binding response OmpR family regulator [Candidatus Azotimanducaceae bacterium]|jgi:DNA-binding response OmpR family regulator
MSKETTILLVDDTPENLDILVDLLRNDYKIKAAPNGQKALDIALQDPPDLILLDIMMPVMDGYETFAKLKQADQTKNIPVVFITAKTEAQDVIKGLKMGAADYVTKPFNPPELLARVINLIDISKRQKMFEDLIEERTKSLRELQTELDLSQSIVDVKTGIQDLTISIPSQLKSASGLVDYLGECLAPVCEKYQFSPVSLNLCLNESLINAIVHGNLGISSELKKDDWGKFYELVAERENSVEYQCKQVVVKYHIDAEKFEIEIEDQGKGFDVNELPSATNPHALLSSGRGVLLIRSYMSNVSWNETGNKITMTKRLA